MENHVKELGIKELADFKLYFKLQGYADGSIHQYVTYMKEFLQYIKEKSIEKLSEVTPEVISKYQLYLSTVKRKRPDKKNLSMITQIHKIVAIMHFFRFLVREKNYLYDPTSHIKLRTPPRKRVREVLSKKEMLRLLNAPNPETPLGLRDKALLELYYSCGIRNTESRMLTVKDADLENRLVRIRFPKGGGDQGGDQTVPIGRIAALYIDEYIRNARPKLLKNDLEETLFLSKNGKPLSDGMPAHIVQKYAAIAKINRKTDAHTLRHTCGTHLYDNGADIRCIQELLRHKSLDTTQIYIDVKATKLRKVLEKTHPRERGIVYAPAIE
ncbi:MAG: tyrosine-type recombinase/integrase [Candidatus Omnitrophota bacterium]